MSWFRVVVSVDFPLYWHDKIIDSGKEYEVGSKDDIDEEKHEVFAVPEANTIVDPWTVMVHV